VLWQDGHCPVDEEIRFKAPAAILLAHRAADWIEIDFPLGPEAVPVAPPDDLLKGLREKPLAVYKAGKDYLVEYDTEQTLRILDPDLTLLGRLDAEGIIVTARGNEGEFDFISRFFGPAIGIPEDPVTGYAHTVLARYWTDKIGDRPMLAYQASERGGIVRVKRRGDRVLIGGQAVTVMRCEMV
jgi:predicted PhzF superfamily epimerase YddE/YHI9